LLLGVFSVAASGLVDFTDHPRLTPWAAFLRRFAAGFHYPYQSVSLSVISLSVGHCENDVAPEGGNAI